MNGSTTDIDGVVLGRKMVCFLKEIKHYSDEMHKADTPTSNFRKSAQAICQIVDHTMMFFQPLIGEYILDDLNKFNKMCDNVAETFPGFKDNLSKEECYELASLIKSEYVHKKPKRFQDGGEFAQRADGAVHMFSRTIVILAKGLGNDVDIEPVLEECVDRAIRREQDEYPGTIVPLFAPREFKL